MSPTEQADAVGAVAAEVDGDWDLVGLPMPRNPALLDPGDRPGAGPHGHGPLPVPDPQRLVRRCDV